MIEVQPRTNHIDLCKLPPKHIFSLNQCLQKRCTVPNHKRRSYSQLLGLGSGDGAQIE